MQPSAPKVIANASIWIDAGRWDHWGQPSLGLGRDRPHPGSARVAELRDSGTQRAQRGIRAQGRRSVRHQRGVLKPRTAGDPTVHRRGRCYGQGPAPSRARLGGTCRRPGRLPGVATVVGLQARQAPAIAFVQELLSDGYVGEVLSTTMVGLSVPGDVVVQPNAYMLDRANSANVLTIAVGHSVDILNYVLGEFADLSAVSDLRRPLITIEGTKERRTKTAPDQIAVIGTLTSGATTSVHIR